MEATLSRSSSLSSEVACLRFSALCGEMDIYERIIDANAHMCECLCLPPFLYVCMCVFVAKFMAYFLWLHPLRTLSGAGHSQCG